MADSIHAPRAARAARAAANVDAGTVRRGRQGSTIKSGSGLGDIWSTIPFPLPFPDEAEAESSMQNVKDETPAMPAMEQDVDMWGHEETDEETKGMQAVVHDLAEHRGEEDVEMIDVSDVPYEEETAPSGHPQHEMTFVALDTNIFISHLRTVKTLYKTLATASNGHSIRLLVPNTVISELDKHKVRFSSSSAVELPTTSAGFGSIHDPRNWRAKEVDRKVALGKVAREAVEWLLDVGRAQREGGKVAVRFQKWDEVTIRERLPKADDRILDCCRYFSAIVPNSRVHLWTDDRNLALQAETHGIPSFGNTMFSAQDICSKIGFHHDRAARHPMGRPCETTTRTGVNESKWSHETPNGDAVIAARSSEQIDDEYWMR